MKDLQSADKTGRRKLTREEKNELCKTWELSGLTRSEFCRREGLKIATFCTWLSRFQNKKKPIKKLKFVPVERMSSKPEIKFEISFTNGLVCRFSSLPEIEALKAIVGELHNVARDPQ